MSFQNITQELFNQQTPFQKFFDEKLEKRIKASEEKNKEKNKEKNNFIQSYENWEKVFAISDKIFNLIYRLFN